MTDYETISLVILIISLVISAIVCVISPLVHKNEGSRINCPHE